MQCVWSANGCGPCGLQLRLDERSVGDGARYRAHIRYRIRPSRHGVPAVLLLEHPNHDEIVDGIDGEPGSVDAAPIKGAGAHSATVEIGMRWTQHNADV